MKPTKLHCSNLFSFFSPLLMAASMESSKPSLLILLISFLLVSSPMYGFLPSTIAQLLPIVASNHTEVYIVHVQHPNGSVDLLAYDDRDDWYRSFLPNTTLDSGEPRMVHTYAMVISGFAARLTAEEATAMESMDGFLYAHPETSHPLHTTHTPQLLGLDQYKSLWRNSDQGEGTIIGVLDTGILPDHPSFSNSLHLPQPPLKWRGRCDLPAGGGSCNRKLIGAQQFITGGGKHTPIDTHGHGSHVAGIAAGSPVYGANVNELARGTASGMAPRAHLAVYRVCVDGGCPDSYSLKGIEQAILDGVDVIQISNGQPSEFHRSGNIKGSFRAMEEGILTVCSAQNQGPYPSLISNDAPWILTVGAATTDRRATAVLKLSNGMKFVGESGYQPNPSGAVDLPLIYPGVNGTQKTLSCQNGSMAGFNVTGKIVLCGTGYTDPVEKSKVVKEAGAAGIIVMNNPWDGDTLRSHPFVVPAVHVSYNNALKILNYFKNEPKPSGSITFRGTEFGVRPSPTVAAFSSRGPSLRNGGILKPDVIAPGVNILSAWPFDVGPNATMASSANSAFFTFASGTSMAAPHVSGVAALLKKAHPDWSPAMIKSAIITTAYTEDRDGQKFKDGADSGAPAGVFAVGAGHVDPSAADDPGLVYDTPLADYIPYLCGLKGMTIGHVISIIKRPASCSKKMAAEDLNYPSIVASMGAPGAKKSIPRTVKNVGKANSLYTASVVPPNGVKVDVNPKTLQFASVGEEKSFTVELSLTGGPPGVKDIWEGRLNWVSSKHQVSSPIVITA